MFCVRTNVCFYPITDFFPDSQSAAWVSDDFVWMICDLVADSEDVRAEAANAAETVAKEVLWLLPFARERPHALLAEYVVSEGDGEVGQTLDVLISRNSTGALLLGAASDTMSY